MLLTCPNCSSQFKISEEVLGEKGRKVKCSECANVWFQKPTVIDHPALVAEDPKVVTEEERTVPTFSRLLDELEEKVDSILVAEDLPSGIKPDPKQKITKSNFGKYVSPIAKDGQKASYAFCSFLFIVILSFLLAQNKNIMDAYPASAAFFSIFGIEMRVPGQNLVFDRMHIRGTENVINIDGSIVNLGKSEQIVPMIQASLQGEGNSIIQKWYISPPKDLIPSEGTLAFSSKTPLSEDQFKKGTNVVLKFVLDPKIGEEASGNTPAPPEGVEIHRNDHEEAAKSPEHASSHSDLESSQSSHH